MSIEGKQTHKCSACNGEGLTTYNTGSDLCQPDTTTMQANGHPYLLHGEIYWLPILQEYGEWHRNGLFLIGPDKNYTVKLNNTAYQMQYETALRTCEYCHEYVKI
jgi:hypothetical protein